MEQIYQDIAARTGGNIYIGVVGPVRTGKSTLIKRFMEQLVIPEITDPYRRERAKDELPQCGSGRTIMTAEPKFVPEEAAELLWGAEHPVRVRLIDTVGYMVDGAAGAEEDGQPRMVTTPWYDHEIPLIQAAEIGTRKVMQEHCTIGLVVTTDGSVTDIPRRDYLEAESRAIQDMQKTGKPFLVIVNSKAPREENAAAVCREIQQKFGVRPLCMDCQTMEESQIRSMLGAVLEEFPVEQVEVYLPGWLDALEPEHPLKTAVYRGLLECGNKITRLSDAKQLLPGLGELEGVQECSLRKIDPGCGVVQCTLVFLEAMFYEILSSRVGMEIADDRALMGMLTELAQMKREYGKLSDALASVKATGYGVVMPAPEEMELQTPELLKKNGTYGVRLKAGAPSIHMMRVEIDTEITPMVGDEQQSKELIDYLRGAEPEQLWKSNIFGKSVYDLIQEGLTAKLIGMPPDVRGKFRGTLTRIVNEGATGLICIIL